MRIQSLFLALAVTSTLIAGFLNLQNAVIAAARPVRLLDDSEQKEMFAALAKAWKVCGLPPGGGICTPCVPGNCAVPDNAGNCTVPTASTSGCVVPKFEQTCQSTTASSSCTDYPNSCQKANPTCYPMVTWLPNPGPPPTMVLTTICVPLCFHDATMFACPGCGP